MKIGINLIKLVSLLKARDFLTILIGEEFKTMEIWQDRIHIDPNICHGKTMYQRDMYYNIPVLLDNLLADGLTSEEILTEYLP